MGGFWEGGVKVLTLGATRHAGVTLTDVCVIVHTPRSYTSTAPCVFFLQEVQSGVTIIFPLHFICKACDGMVQITKDEAGTLKQMAIASI